MSLNCWENERLVSCISETATPAVDRVAANIWKKQMTGKQVCQQQF